MNDLISRQAAIDALGMMLPVKWFDKAETALYKLPSAQKRGRWVNHLGLPLNDFCSVCAKDSPYNKHWDYCPNCGARNGGEE